MGMKPDRLTKLVEQRAGYAQTFHPTSLVLHKEKVLTLLRREQRAQRARVVKIVKQHMKERFPYNNPFDRGYQDACGHILKTLHERTP